MRYRVIAWLVAAATLAYLTRNSVGVIESTVRAELGLTKEQSGWFLGAFFWSYAILQIPSGWMGHACGARLSFGLMAFTWSLGAALLGLSPALWALVTAQLLMGAAQAGIMPCSAQTISHWVPLARRSSSCGAVGMGLQIGAILAGTLTAALLTAGASWRAIYLLYAVPGILWAAWFALRFRNYPEQDRAVNGAELAIIHGGHCAPPDRQRIEPTPWKALAASPTMWYLCGQQVCRSAGYSFFAAWLPTFLQTTRGVSREESGYIQSLVLGGALFGSLLGGFFSDWVLARTRSLHASRRGVGAVSQLVCGLLILGAFYVQDTRLLVGLMVLGAFCTFAGGVNALSVSIDIGGQHGGQVYAIQNMFGCFAAGYIPVLVGRIFDAAKHPDDWNRVLLLFALIYFAGAVCWAMVDPTRRLKQNTD